MTDPHETLSGTEWYPPHVYPENPVEPVPLVHVYDTTEMQQGWIHPPAWLDGGRPEDWQTTSVDTAEWNRLHPPEFNWTGLAKRPGVAHRPELLGERAGSVARVVFDWP
jgi:hypothetical protein